MSNFVFGGINTNIKKKNVNHISASSSPLFYSCNNSKDKHILVLIESMSIKQDLLFSLKTWLHHSLGSEFDFDIVSASLLTFNRDKIKKNNIEDFYKESLSDFKQYIRPDKTIILTMGYAITATTLNSDITVSGFYDVVFNRSYFYSPRTETKVVPIDSPDYLFKKDINLNYVKKDCSRQQFAEYQLYQIKTRYDEIVKPITPKRIVIKDIKSTEEFIEVCKTYSDSKVYPKIAWDTETSGFHFIKNRVGYLSFTFDGITAYVVPWKYADIRSLNKILSPKKQVGANLKFDCKFLQYRDIKSARIDSDVVSLGRVLNEMRSNSLKSLAYYYTEWGGYDDELDEYKKKYKITNYLEIPYPLMREYAGMDAIVTYHVEEKQMAQLRALDIKFPPPTYGDKKGWTFEKYYNTVVIPSLNSFTKIEQVGISVNMEIWDRNSDIVDGKIKELKKELSESLCLNATSAYSSSLDFMFEDTLSFLDEKEEEDEEGKKLTSSKKLGELLKSLKWPCHGTSKAGYYLTGDEQLQRWEQDGYKEATIISNLRSYLVLQRTFLGRKGTDEGWRQYIVHNKEEGSYKLYPVYNVLGTTSGRNSCSSPNFQQVPSGANDSHLFKQIFTTPDINDFLMLNIDKKAYQVKISSLDILDQNDPLYKGYIENPNLDLHSLTGYNVFAKGEKYTFVELNNKEYYSEQLIKIERNGQVIQVKAIDVLESDDLYEQS